MKIRKLFVLFALTVACFSCSNYKDGKIHCRIEGTVPDSTYDIMLLAPEGTNLRSVEPIAIPVKDCKFAFDLYVDEIAPYELVPKVEYDRSRWFSGTFFAEEGTVNLTFYHYEKVGEFPTVKSETPNNKRYLQLMTAKDSIMDPLYKEQDSLIDAGKWDSPQIMELFEQFNSTDDKQKKEELRKQADKLYDSGEAYTPEYYAFQSKYKEALKDRERFFIDYIHGDRSLVGLFVLKNQMQWSRDSSNDSIYTVLYNDVYRSLFPGHSLSKYIEMWIGSRNIKVGGRYVDFSAPDLSGTQHTLSKEIAGKVALIDLWASWCGPCRRVSKSMIPIYEKYKERGFTVVGVARENKRENLEQAVVTDGYPWLNLLELNDENKIWVKYGIENAAGNAILVDRDGTILAIYPTAEEVERILQEKL